MQSATTARPENAGALSPSEAILRRLPLRPPWAEVASFSLAVCLFFVDATLPRGATAAIGYCLVPVFAAGARRRDFLLAMTIASTALTWAGFFLEPVGSLAWMSAFDRAMVTGVLWLIFLLVSRRSHAVTALAHQTHALEETTRELERSNAELDRFASVVAHDLRGPLNTIGLFAHLLGDRNSPKTDGEIAESVATIQREVNSLSTLIQSVLSYARVGSGEVHLASCDFSAALDSVRLKLKAELDRCAAEISSDPLPSIHADRTLIEQLLQNLIENSLKYRSDSPPLVHVSAVEEPAGWRFFVRDNGMGIKPEDAERVFMPFHQLDRGKKDRGGVGLGLASCKRIVERHGGRIGIVPSQGRGATLTFTIVASPPKRCS